jgi:hypothetical protein
MRMDTHFDFSAVLLAAWLAAIPRSAIAQHPGGQPPVLTVFSINATAESVPASAPSVSLSHTVVGAAPSEYRVSHRADFLGARWIPYAVPLTVRDWYDSSGSPCDGFRSSHRVTLYLQVRARVGEQIRIVEGQRQLVPANVESNVLRATICAYRAPQTPSTRGSRQQDPLTAGEHEGYSVAR